MNERELTIASNLTRVQDMLKVCHSLKECEGLPLETILSLRQWLTVSCSELYETLFSERPERSIRGSCLSVRAKNCLCGEGLKTDRDVWAWAEENRQKWGHSLYVSLIRIPHMGRKTVN